MCDMPKPPEVGSVGKDGSVRIGCPWDHAAAWARIRSDGGIELELYDHSPSAEQHFGNDVAWLYRVPDAEIPRLTRALEARIGQRITDREKILQTFATHFDHVHAIRDWLKASGIPYEEHFDSWA